MSTYAVVNPATDEVLKEYPEISDADLKSAIGRADDAHRAWSAGSTVAERAELVRAVGRLHTERRQALGEIIVREMGKPIEQALGEAEFAGAIYEFYADNAESLMADEPIELLGGEGTALVRRSSYGVLLGIMPWNYPYYQVARFAGPNHVIGNTLLLKHAPQCPESAEAIAQIFKDAGYPEGAYENIYATNEQIEWVIADPRVRGVSVTGSERAGAAVAEIAGRNLKKVVLELGGSDPFILLGTDDVADAAEKAAEARLENAGQACNAAKRFIVLDSLYDEFLEQLKGQLTGAKTGDPTAEGTAIGPLSSKAAADRLDDQVKRAVAGRRRDPDRRQPRRQLLRADDPHRHQARRRGLPGRVLRAGRAGLQGRLRGGGDRARERHPVRARLLPDDDRPGAGRTGRRPDRSRDGLRQHRRRGQPRAALRRLQALRLRPRARSLRRRRVRQQEADPHRLGADTVASRRGASDNVVGDGHPRR